MRFLDVHFWKDEIVWQFDVPMEIVMEENASTEIRAEKSSKLLRLIARHPLKSFFLMSFLFTWLVVLPYILSVWGIVKGDLEFLYIIKPFVGPMLAAVVTIYATQGKEGLARLRKRLGQRRAPWKWYFLILVAVPVLLLVGIIVQPSMLGSFKGLSAKILISYPLYFAVVFFGVALPEEIGWRGFALPRMQKNYGALKGTLILGLLWSLWHLPFFLTPGHGGGPNNSYEAMIRSFGYFVMLVMAFSVIFTWVFNHTGGSIFVANILHASIDTPQLVWIPLFPFVNEVKLNMANVIAFILPAILIVAFTKGKLGYKRENAEPI